MADPLLTHRDRILQALGEGGFGKTFLAEDTQMPLEIDPNNADIYANIYATRGDIYISQNRPQKAVEDYSQAI